MGLERRQIHVAYAYQRIAEEIESQILEGTLKPGEQLPGETEMAEMFGVTRSTVREGLRRLESEGLVCRPTPRRLVVAIPRIDRLSTRSGRTMALMKVTYRELWQVTLKTEMLAARLAAEMAKDDEIAALKSLHEELSGAEGNARRTIELDGRFQSQDRQEPRSGPRARTSGPSAVSRICAGRPLCPAILQTPDRGAFKYRGRNRSPRSRPGRNMGAQAYRRFLARRADRRAGG